MHKSSLLSPIWAHINNKTEREGSWIDEKTYGFLVVIWASMWLVDCGAEKVQTVQTVNHEFVE